MLTQSLSDIRITERLRILIGVDAAECQRCKRAVGAATTQIINVAEDPRWFIDSHLEPNDQLNTTTELAEIYCPSCW